MSAGGDDCEQNGDGFPDGGEARNLGVVETDFEDEDVGLKYQRDADEIQR
jgi:hypothetical protein